MQATVRTVQPRPVDRATRVLQVLLVVAIVESFIHYADNTLRYDDYTVSDPSLLGSLVKQWTIPISWVLFTAAALVGYRRFREGRWPQAAAWIGAYSASGLISVFHYVDISLSDLSAFQNTFVFLDVIVGALVLGFAVWTAVRGPATCSPGRRSLRSNGVSRSLGRPSWRPCSTPTSSTSSTPRPSRSRSARTCPSTRRPATTSATSRCTSMRGARAGWP